jgi:FtsP/CotA-like multicopper oxidase with cupredoxin domain
MNKPISRRDFLKLAGGAVITVAGAGLLPQFLRKTLSAEQVVAADTVAPNLFFGGTDGWFWLPPSPNMGSLHPDVLAPAPFTTYIFGFRNVTEMTDGQRQNQRQKAQHTTPFFWVDEYVDADENEFRLQLTNLGLALRPDLTDNHTLHWHGFRNVIPLYDGEPTGSVAVPVGQRFTYVYRPRDPGTYMYHCHVEDIEHVTMGMTGIVFVRPQQNGTDIGGFTKFAYNDGNGSTGYHREFAMLLSEIWIQGHWNDAHIQESDWSLFKADFSLINGRVYPDTLLPNAPVDLTAPSSAHSLAFQIQPPGAMDGDVSIEGDLKTNPGLEHLQYQPHSALITCNEDENVLLRFANLGFREGAMTLAGIPMKVVGRDATPMKGRDGTDTSYTTDTLMFGAGESFDVIFTAPAYDAAADVNNDGYNTYMLYNRRYTQEQGTHGQRTEVRVYPAGTLPAQQYLNQHPDDDVAS